MISTMYGFVYLFFTIAIIVWLGEQSCAPEPGIHGLLKTEANALMSSLEICTGASRG